MCGRAVKVGALAFAADVCFAYLFYNVGGEFTPPITCASEAFHHSVMTTSRVGNSAHVATGAGARAIECAIIFMSIVLIMSVMTNATFH